LVTFRAHLPPRRQVLLVFAACAFPIYTWAIVAFLWKLPSWLLFLRASQILAVFGYTQLSALAESLLLLLAILLLSLLLPRRFFRDRFVAQGGMVALVTAAWAIALQLNVEAVTNSLSLRTIALWITLFLVPTATLFLLIHHRPRVAQVIEATVDRLLVLLYIYLPLTLLGVSVVVVRNIAGRF
jgi:hypothetical protein